MPREKSLPKKCFKGNIQEPINSWVCLLKGEALEFPEQYTGSESSDIITLRHPNTGKAATFMFSPTNNSIQEILTFNECKRSWFINDSVKSDGKLHLSTPIDPLFLILPYLQKYCTSRAVPLDHFLKDEDFPETERLLKCSGLKYLNMICDRKGDEELNAFKYNEEKSLNYLKQKTEKVAEILKQKNIHVGHNSVVSATFISASREDTLDNNVYLHYAHGIVSEYLAENISQKLLKYLNLPEDINFQNTLKRKSAITDIPESKRVKMEEENKSSSSNILDLSTPIIKSPKIASVKDKARLKAASGSKTISSFFKKT